MPTLTIPLSQKSMQLLQELATQAGVEPEELLGAIAETWLTTRTLDFSGAAAYVLQKNAELYRRLAG